MGFQHLFVMEIGNTITQLRKQKGLSHEDFGNTIGTSDALIGHYERAVITPSVEIANALGVSFNYLLSNASTVVKDKKIMKRMETVADMPEAEQAQIFKIIDAYIRDHRAKKAYAS